MSEGIVDVVEVWEDVSERFASWSSSRSCSGVRISAGYLLSAAVGGAISCSIDGSSLMCADCTIDASSVAILSLLIVVDTMSMILDFKGEPIQLTVLLKHSNRSSSKWVIEHARRGHPIKKELRNMVLPMLLAW